MVRASGPVSLRDTWFGARLPEEAVSRLEPHVRRATYDAGTEILREGDPTSALGIVVSGRVALRLRVPERGPTTVLTAEPGNIVGWSAVVPPHRATSTAVALDPDRAAAPRRRGAASPAGRRPGPCRRGLSLAARGGCASPQRHAHAAARPVRTARGRAVVTATTTPAFLPRADLGRLLRPAPRRRPPDHRPDPSPGRHRLRRDRHASTTFPRGWTATQAPGSYRLQPTGNGPAVRLRGRTDVLEARDLPAARPADRRTTG